MALVLGASLLTGCGVSLLTTPPATPVPVYTSMAQADQALEQAARERARLDRVYAETEAGCYHRFFVNSCLEDARETHHAAMDVVRAAEVEAARVKRKLDIEERDRALAKAQQEFEAEQARLAAEPPQPAPEAKPDVPPPPPHAALDRSAEHAKEERERAAREAAEAPQRAKNAATLEKRRADAARHAQDVARRKAEKAAKLEAAQKQKAADEAKAK